jgi:ribosomal-protein-alanine N-acetyltransferase
MIEPPPIALSTTRLSLRIPSHRDAAAMVAYVGRNRAHFARWEPRHPPEYYSEPWWRERLELDARNALEGRSFRFVLATLEEPARIVGQIHFSNIVRGAFHCCHLGFGIDRDAEGRGLMREGLERALRWAFDDLRLHRVEANHRPENVRSGGLLRRLGFVPQGYARDYLFIDGAWRDHVLTALLNQAWAPPDGT